jgi:hypothetical protein
METETIELHPDATKNITAVREMLDFLESHPAIANAGWLQSHFTAFVYDKESFDQLRRQLGPHSKRVTNYDAIAERTLTHGARVTVAVQRDEVCEKVKTGERTVEKEVYPDDVKPLTVVETEDVYEWVCPDSWGNS